MNIWSIINLLANSTAASRIGRRLLTAAGAWVAAKAGDDVASWLTGAALIVVGEGLSWLARRAAAETTATVTPADTSTGAGPKSGQSIVGVLLLTASAGLMCAIIMSLMGCGTIAARIQTTDDALAARVPGGPAALARLRGELATRSGYVSTAGMVRVSQWWDVDHDCAITNNIELREWYIRRTPIITQPANLPAPDITAALPGENNPHPAAGSILNGPVTGTVVP